MKLKVLISRVIRRFIKRDEISNPHDLATLSLLVKQAIDQRNFANNKDHVVGVVFSKDRAIQLYALIESYITLVENKCKLYVIYCASNAQHAKAYEEVFSNSPDYIIPIRQIRREDFKDLVIECLLIENSEYCFFLVDDNLFIETVDILSFASLSTPYSVPSLRLGANLSRSYTLQRYQALPLFKRFMSHAIYEQNFISFKWSEGNLDWSYPLSVDGHVFHRREIIASLKCIEFDSPNRLEEGLQLLRIAFNWRLGICYEKSRLINIPYNRVQSDVDNIYGSIHQDSLLKMWQDGYQIDIKSYQGFVNQSAHQELPLNLKMRSFVDSKI